MNMVSTGSMLMSLKPRSGQGNRPGQEVSEALAVQVSAVRVAQVLVQMVAAHIGTLPAGVANGQVIKLKGYGGEGINGGPAGDLYITFVIAEDPVFKRLDNDLYVGVEIDLYTALLGGEKLVDTLEGQVKLKVKPETQNGTKVRLKGKGFPVYKKEGQSGDLIVTYSVKLPTNLTEQQKEMFRKIQSMN